MAVLPHEKDLRFAVGVVNREHNDGTCVTNDVTANCHSGGFKHLIGCDPEGRPAIGSAGRKDSRFLLHGFFRHGNNIRDVRRGPAWLSDEALLSCPPWPRSAQSQSLVRGGWVKRWL